MMEIDWHRLLFDDQPYGFFIEILFRTTIMFFAVVFVLRMAGKRGIQQLSIFEMVMIITLGSAAGDSMFYKDVGMLHALAVFAVILVLYRLVILLITKSTKIEIILEGKPVYLLKDGKICIDAIDRGDLGADEFFGELRTKSIEHLGQLRYVILEDTGTLSLFYYADDQVRVGLPILPDEYNKKSHIVLSDGIYACARCGNTQSHKATDITVRCDLCDNGEWVRAIDRKRIV